MSKKIKLCVVITDPMNLWSLYREQFLYLQKNGFEITAIASSGVEHDKLKKMGINSVAIDMQRAPSAFKDFISLLQLIRFFITNRFDIVSVSTPKASLLGSLAAFITFQKNIIFTIRGRAYENKKGFGKKIFENIDKLICKLSDSVFSISHEIKDDFIAKGLCKESKIFVIGSGSSNGVDLRKFTKTEDIVKKANIEKKALGISDSEICILYSGRIRKDKGVEELVDAFLLLEKEFEKICLLIQGKEDSVDKIDNSILSTINTHPKIYRADWSYEVENYFAMADIFAFPSYREGFGNVAIEASAMELPIVAFDVVGCRESIIDKKTGLLSKAFKVNGLYENLKLLIEDEKLRNNLGQNGRKRVEKEFDSFYIWNELIKKYNELLKGNK
ncbi:MAG: glycosyltransferase family 4 protein [Campylobacterota bacterium]